RGVYCPGQASSQGLGVMAATGLGVLLTAMLTVQQMQAYGWRIPLLVGCLIIPILFWLRRSLQETEVFEKSTHARTTGEIMRILLEHWQIVLIGVLFVATRYPAQSCVAPSPCFTRLLVVEFWLAILYAMYAGALVPFIVEIMPAKVRSSGYAIILSFANGIFGTFTPFIVTALIRM